MTESFAQMLAEGGKKNSLGRANDVLDSVLKDKSRLEELYLTIFDEDAWIRMRAIDTFEKVCREQPEWIVPYIDRMQEELSSSSQPSIQWHLAEIYPQVNLNDAQKTRAITWLSNLLATTQVDWIAAANSMKALVTFAKRGEINAQDVMKLFDIQMNHTSNAVKRKALKLKNELTM